MFKEIKELLTVYGELSGLKTLVTEQNKSLRDINSQIYNISERLKALEMNHAHLKDTVKCEIKSDLIKEMAELKLRLEMDVDDAGKFPPQ